MEKMIWSAAFVAEWHHERVFRQTHRRDHLPVDGMPGFSCAEVADEALKKYREALVCDDKEYLIPVKENWV
jgi:hypothetical protein